MEDHPANISVGNFTPVMNIRNTRKNQRGASVQGNSMISFDAQIAKNTRKNNVYQTIHSSRGKLEIQIITAINIRWDFTERK